MTMPYGSTEEPMREETALQSVPIHVASSDLKPGKNVAAEIGQWRTLVLPVGSAAQRLLSRAINRRQARFWVVGAQLGTTTATSGAVAAPAANTPLVSTAQLPAGAYQVAWTVGLEGTPAQPNDTNNFQLRANVATQATSENLGAVGQYPQQPQTIILTTPGTIVIRNANAGTVGSIYEASLTVTPVLANTGDGIIVGTKDVLSQVGAVASQIGTPGAGGGFLPLGVDPRVENQQELWVAPAVGNNDTVYVTVLDELYSSMPEDYRSHGMTR